MKTPRLLILGSGLLALGLLLGGCTTAAGTIEAASTKVEIRQGKTKGLAIVLPKELDASALDVEIDPKSGHIKLHADKLKSSSQALIESAGTAQANAIAVLSKAVSDVLPVLLKAAGAAAAPQTAAVAAEVLAAPPAEPAK